MTAKARYRAIESRRGTAHSYADCVTCSERHHGDDKPALARAWARRHAENNPGHQAHVTTETVRAYRAVERGKNG